MDLPWLENPPGYQFLHCLMNSAKGGDSSAVDAFAVAKYIKNNHKEEIEHAKMPHMRASNIQTRSKNMI